MILQDRDKMLRRDPDGLIGGVCSGIAAFFGTSPQRIRLAVLLLSLPMLIVPWLLVMPFIYLGFWIIIPKAVPGKGLESIETNKKKYK